MREEFSEGQAHDKPGPSGIGGGQPRSGTDARTVVRIVLWSLLALVLLLLVVQNGDQTEVRFLGWTVAMPRFALILASAALGAVIAVLWMLLRGRRGSS